MTRPHVFISYSHSNERILQNMLSYLELLRRDGTAEIWVDTGIKGGDLWLEKIDAALEASSIVVLLISQPFLASRFVYEEELPRILCRQREGKLTVLPVFLGPSTVASTRVPFTDADGNVHHVILSDFQGFGTPSKTLKDLTPAERDRVFVALHDRIKELAANPYHVSDFHGESPQQPSSADAAEQSFAAPSAVILDRHYAYLLTSYATDAVQQQSAQLLMQYDELFDALTCSMILFDEIYVEQHHVSSLDFLLNERELSAYRELFTPFSLADPVGPMAGEAVIEGMIAHDLNDSALTPLVLAYHGRRPIRPQSNRELVVYLNRVLQHAAALDAAILSRPSRMPLFRHKFRQEDSAGRCSDGVMALASLEISMPIPKWRHLDELAALRSERKWHAVRAHTWQQAQEWATKQCSGGHYAAESAGASAKGPPRREVFARSFELSVGRLPAPIGARDWYFLCVKS